MLDQAQREQLKPAVRTMQIIVGALAFGLLTFQVVVLFLVSQNANGPAGGLFLTYLTVPFALCAVIAWAVVPGVLARQMRQAIADGRAAQEFTTSHHAVELGDVPALTLAYQTTLIVGCALLEGGAFFCVVTCLLERHPISVILALVLLLLLLTQIPSAARVESWIEGELNTIEQLRLLHRS